MDNKELKNNDPLELDKDYEFDEYESLEHIYIEELYFELWKEITWDIDILFDDGVWCLADRPAYSQDELNYIDNVLTTTCDIITPKQLVAIYFFSRYNAEITKCPVERKRLIIEEMAKSNNLIDYDIINFQDFCHKIDTIDAMAKLDREILSSIDKFSILRTAIVLTSRLIPCDRAAVYLKSGDSYMTVTEWGFGKFTDKTYDIKDSRFNDIEMIQGPLFIPEIFEESVNFSYYQEQKDLGIKSAMIVPLVSKGEMLGFVDIGSAYYGGLTTEHLSTAEKIASQITVALEHVRLYEDLEQLLINTVTSLISTIDAKSPWTKGHSERVTKYSVEIAKEMGLRDKEINHVRMCGLLHDIGKVGTFDGLLDKPDKLTKEEFELIKKHPGQGADIIAPIKQLSNVIPGILHHHERYDGKGYPLGIRGSDIPLCASILAVADSFDSMTADRPYRKAPGKEYAISELKRCSGTQFDPKVVEVFLRVLAKNEIRDMIFY